MVYVRVIIMAIVLDFSQIVQFIAFTFVALRLLLRLIVSQLEQPPGKPFVVNLIFPASSRMSNKMIYEGLVFEDAFRLTNICLSILNRDYKWTIKLTEYTRYSNPAWTTNSPLNRKYGHNQPVNL